MNNSYCTLIEFLYEASYSHYIAKPKTELLGNLG